MQSSHPEININIKLRNAGTEHLSVFTIYGTTLRFNIIYLLVQAITQPAPMASLHLLYIYGFPKYGNTRNYHQYITEVNSPEYVAFYVHFSVFGFWSLVFGLWLLVFSLWLLVFGLWSLVFGFWSLVFGFWSLVFGFFIFSHYCSLLQLIILTSQYPKTNS
jgi:hypothetical protein